MRIEVKGVCQFHTVKDWTVLRTDESTSGVSGVNVKPNVLKNKQGQSYCETTALNLEFKRSERIFVNF